jgi:hypothetical protein
MFNSIETLKNIPVKLDLVEIRERLHLASGGGLEPNPSYY